MKKSIIIHIFSFVVLTLLFVQCSSIKIDRKKQVREKEAQLYIPAMNLKVIDNDCWVDLMPGRQRRFHVSGRLEILNSIKYDLKLVKLKFIKLYQSKKLIYKIIPFIQIDKKLSSKKNEVLIYSTLQGLLLTKDLDFNKKVSLKFIFYEGSNRFDYKIDGITIKKVY